MAVPMTTPTAPYDRYTNRLTDSRGGEVLPRGRGHEIRPGLVDGHTRWWEPNNGGISRDRTPTYDHDYLGSYHDSLVNWDDCGPARPSLWMRNTWWNRQQGSDATRNYDPHAVDGYGTRDQGHGMHTNTQQPKTRTNANFRNRVQQQPARINRLASAVYTGQSYSQTTAIQGG